MLAVCDSGVARSAQVQALAALYGTYKPSTERTAKLKKLGREFFSALQYKLPLRFAKDHWRNWSANYKIDFLKKAHDLQAAKFGCPAASLSKAVIASNAIHYCSSNHMDISERDLACDKREILPALIDMFHEGVHAQQCYQVNTVPTPDTLMLAVQYYPGAYISPDESFAGYQLNPVEVEARTITDAFVGQFNSPTAWIT